jgi:hypothetical protein
MFVVVYMDELQDPDMVSKKSRKQKDPIIELSPDRARRGTRDRCWCPRTNIC